MSITLETIEARQSELEKMIQTFKQQAGQPVLHRHPEADILLQPGEHYAGPVLDEAGKVVHHLVLMAARPTGRLDWQDAMNWASSAGGALPSRQEHALLYANCKPHLEPFWYWSSETYEEDASYAWHCHFYFGGQSYYHKSYEGSAVAVRLIPITA